MIGCPIRNRAWILPLYLESLQALKYPEAKIEYCFIINDCSDQTPLILEHFAEQKAAGVKLITINYGSEKGYRRGMYDFSRLAALRNHLLNAFLQSDCEYLFSLDSDILAPPDTLTRLIEDNCDIVSALVCNGHELNDQSIYNILRRNHEGKLVHWRDFPRDRIFPVDCTGAAYLIKRAVIASCGVRYSSEQGAEDIGFCSAAAQKGLGIYGDGRLECVHMMHEKIINSDFPVDR